MIELAYVGLTGFVITYLARRMPLLEGIFFFFTVIGFVSTVVVLWMLGAPHRPSAAAVFPDLLLCRRVVELRLEHDGWSRATRLEFDRYMTFLVIFKVVVLTPYRR